MRLQSTPPPPQGWSPAFVFYVVRVAADVTDVQPASCIVSKSSAQHSRAPLFINSYCPLLLLLLLLHQQTYALLFANKYCAQFSFSDVTAIFVIVVECWSASNNSFCRYDVSWMLCLRRCTDNSAQSPGYQDIIS